MKFRWFPFLGFKTLSDEEKELYGVPLKFTVKALTFEWFSLHMILVGKASQEVQDGD
jgi:hypothetical protein